MSFWSVLTGSDISPNSNPSPASPPTVGPNDWTPGVANGLEFVDVGEKRGHTNLVASPWDGWPSGWGLPSSTSARLDELVDTAWTCLDLNASVLSTMPVYKLQGGKVVEPEVWMTNPDPSIYSSWNEFAKELFWDYMTGEAFIRVVSYYSSGMPATFRVVPPWAVEVEMGEFGREYRIGQRNVTEDILHIRYKSSTGSARGIGPLEVAGARMLSAGLLSKYVTNLVQTGGIPLYTLETEQSLTPEEANNLLEQWISARAGKLGLPAVLDNAAELKTHQSMSPKDMAMIEIAQFTEARIAVMLGVPPFLVGLPSGDSMTYSNVSSVFDFHDRSSLRPKAAAVMTAMSGWALPRGSSVELNRDEYSRPSFGERADAYVKLVAAGIMSVDEIRAAERLTGDVPSRVLGGVPE
ncbi:MAG: phage portal protein [Ilumatobacteraceae bacterium]